MGEKQFSSAADFAVQTNQAFFHLSCSDKDDENATLKLPAVCPCVPRVGEEVLLDDGTLCRVTKVIYRTVAASSDEEKFALLVPNVWAEKMLQTSGLSRKQMP